MKTKSNSFRFVALLTLVAACFLLTFASTTKTAVKRIETDQAQGLTDNAIVVGMLVPTKGALAETGEAIRAVTAAYFEEINSQGGIYGRKLELKIAETGDTSAATATNLERLITNDRVFALTNVFSAGADREIAALAQKNEIPLVGAITLTPQTDAFNRHVFYLLPGVVEQARALVSFAAQKFDKTSRFAIVYTEGNTISTLSANAVDAQSKSLTWPLPPRVVVKALPEAMATAVAELKNRNTQGVYFFGTGSPSTFLTEAEKANFFPHIYLLVRQGEPTSSTPLLGSTAKSSWLSLPFLRTSLRTA